MTDRDRVVAEIHPPEPTRSPVLADAFLTDAVRKGWLRIPVFPPGAPLPASHPVAPLSEILRDSGQRQKESVIYLDTSVALAALLAEDRRPPESFWVESLIATRLREYEVWTRLHARELADSHAEAARLLIGRTALLELAPPMLVRALDAFPAPVRALGALHLASIEYLREKGQMERRIRTRQAAGPN